jgi:hypothetical protein
MEDSMRLFNVLSAFALIALPIAAGMMKAEFYSPHVQQQMFGDDWRADYDKIEACSRIVDKARPEPSAPMQLGVGGGTFRIDGLPCSK